MRDIPLFTTENGVGSLVFKEIPYSGIAYVTIHGSSFLPEFIHECVDFCRAVGANTVLASGKGNLDNFPFHSSVIRMSAQWEMVSETEACLFPVTVSTLSRWREIYNDRMKHVDNAAYMSEKAANEMLKRGDGYFIHKNGELFGIGIAADDRIDCIASVSRGKGREVVAALTHALICDRVVLEVASTNLRAIRLYESMGFIQTAEVSRWHKIF